MSMRYLIAGLFSEAANHELRERMDDAAAISGKPAPYLKMPPHLSLHPPIENDCISEEELLNAIPDMIAGVGNITVVTGNPVFFGKELFVIPLVSQTLELSRLWVNAHDRILAFPNQPSGQYDAKNTLHITIASKLTPLSHRARQQIAVRVPVPKRHLPLEAIALYKKSAGVQNERWVVAGTFLLPK